jgi:hypothetical protein
MMIFFIAFYESYLSTACILSLGHQGGEHGRLLGPREGHHHHLLRELQRAPWHQLTLRPQAAQRCPHQGKVRCHHPRQPQGN